MKTPSLDDVYRVHGDFGAAPPTTTLVLDSPHSGRVVPADFGSVRSDLELRDGEDCFIDELYLPLTASGVPLLAAQFPRTYLDANRHADDVDLSMLADPWPHRQQPSGKARNGKALLWRALDDGRLLYNRQLPASEVLHRIAHYHRPYHQTLQRLLNAVHSHFGVVHHINCHSMNAVSGAMAEGGAGIQRADFVLGDRDGTTCAPDITAFVRERLMDLGYEVKVNDPFKGVELVRAYANPSAGRHGLQIEISKRLYMFNDRIEKHDGFAVLQAQVVQLLRDLRQQFAPTNAA